MNVHYSAKIGSATKVTGNFTAPSNKTKSKTIGITGSASMQKEPSDYELNDRVNDSMKRQNTL